MSGRDHATGLGAAQVAEPAVTSMLLRGGWTELGTAVLLAVGLLAAGTGSRGRP